MMTGLATPSGGWTTGPSCTPILFVALFCLCAPAVARAQTEFKVDRGGKVYHLGDSCVRRSDQKPGVVKRDACARWYCGLTDVKSVSERYPDIAGKLGCTWQLIGDRCRCMRNISPMPR